MTNAAVPFSQYMQDALYGENGYYMAARTRFGRAGDYYTSAQVSPVFGELWARFFDSRVHGDSLAIVEVGAGDGDFAASVLTELVRIAKVPIRYAALELSPVGRERTQNKLRRIAADAPFGRLTGNVYATLAELHAREPTAYAGGIVFANEWLDAIPCEVLRVSRAGGVERLWVVEGRRTAAAKAGPFCGERLDTMWQPTMDAQIKAYADRWILPLFAALRDDPPDWLVAEAAPQCDQALSRLVEALAPSCVALVDYGGYSIDVVGVDRPRGSLRAYREHRLVDDFIDLQGRVDLTYDVDFGPVRERFEQYGYTVDLTKQGMFLVRLPFFEKVVSARAATDARVYQNIKTLVMPGAMGERFMVLLAERG